MNDPNSSLVIHTNDEARAAVGKRVRVRGTVQREKLGDTLNLGDLSVRCPDFRFPDGSVGTAMTAEGTLEIVVDEAVTISPRGEISQGVEQGTSSFVLRGCTVR